MSRLKVSVVDCSIGYPSPTDGNPRANDGSEGMSPVYESGIGAREDDGSGDNNPLHHHDDQDAAAVTPPEGQSSSGNERPTPRGRPRTRRGNARRPQPTQGKLYEDYMAAKIRAEEARADNYRSGAEANRAALQASLDQSKASRDTSRAMQAMALYYENENRKNSSGALTETGVFLMIIDNLCSFL